MDGAAPLSRIEDLLRECAPQVLAAVLRRFTDFAAAEDAVQEALLAAAMQWPCAGLPECPRAWLIQVALRRMLDQQRSELARREREHVIAAEFDLQTAQIAEVTDLDPQDTLILLFMCCHPALSSTSAVALTLRAVGGLTTAEIARAFLVPEATMAQRISRAKSRIRAARLPFRQPDASERAARIEMVLHALYLIFNEGYVVSDGDQLVRTDLSQEAIRLTRILLRLLPQDPEVSGLLALMLLTDARRAARSSDAGELVPLDEQDRSRWDARLIAEGVQLVSCALRRGAIGVYQLQAAIAALHDEAPSVECTDWPQIQALYAVHLRIADNPIVRLNHAIAVAMVQGPAAGLELLDRLALDERIAGHHRLDAARAHLLERSQQHAAANALYRSAAGKTCSLPERDYLIRCAARAQSAARHAPESA